MKKESKIQEKAKMKNWQNTETFEAEGKGKQLEYRAEMLLCFPLLNLLTCCKYIMGM